MQWIRGFVRLACQAWNLSLCFSIARITVRNVKIPIKGPQTKEKPVAFLSPVLSSYELLHAHKSKITEIALV